MSDQPSQSMFQLHDILSSGDYNLIQEQTHLPYFGQAVAGMDFSRLEDFSKETFDLLLPHLTLQTDQLTEATLWASSSDPSKQYMAHKIVERLAQSRLMDKEIFWLESRLKHKYYFNVPNHAAQIVENFKNLCITERNRQQAARITQSIDQEHSTEPSLVKKSKI